MLMTITIIFKICGGQVEVHTCFFCNFAPQYFIYLQFYNCITFYFIFSTIPSLRNNITKQCQKYIEDQSWCLMLGDGACSQILVVFQ